MALVTPSLENDSHDYYYDPLRLNRKIIPALFPNRSWTDDFDFILHPLAERRLNTLQRRLGTVADNAAAVGRDGFHVCVDVHKFEPEEVTVKTSDRYISIEGKHGERKDEHGFITRHFSRRYALPAGYDPNTVTCDMSSDGILTIKAPKPIVDEGEVRVVPITHSRGTHLNQVKEHNWFE